jgi:hypothetical protein
VVTELFEKLVRDMCLDVHEGVADTVHVKRHENSRLKKDEGGRMKNEC